MPVVSLQLDENKKLQGISRTDQERYATFRHRVANLGSDSIIFEWKEPRSGPFHRRFFKILTTLFENQDSFKDFEMFRAWLLVGAAYCEFFPTHTGEMVAIPKSIAYDKLDQVEFKEVTDKVLEYARSEHARLYMWPHLSDGVSEQMISVLLKEFE